MQGGNFCIVIVGAVVVPVDHSFRKIHGINGYRGCIVAGFVPASQLRLLSYIESIMSSIYCAVYLLKNVAKIKNYFHDAKEMSIKNEMINFLCF